MATSITACFARVAKTLSPEDREQVLAPLRRDILAQLDAQRSDGADARALAVQIIDRMLADTGAAAARPAEGTSQDGMKPKNLREAIDKRKQNAENAATAPVAESLAPGRSADGDAGVATSQGGGSAVHQDPGERPEVATAGVVKEAIAKAADRKDMTPAQIKAEALRLIDEAIAKAPSVEDGDRAVHPDNLEDNERARRYREIMKEGLAKTYDEAHKVLIDRFVQATPRTTIAVPGDGKFTVVNTKERLRAFRALVEKSPGFSGKTAKPRIEKAVSSGNLSPNGLAREMLDDGEPLNAMQVLDAAGKPMAFGSVAEGTPIPYTDVQDETINGDAGFFSGHSWSSKKGADAWAVIDKTSGLAAGSGVSRAAAVSVAQSNLKQAKNLERLAKARESEAKPQEDLRAAFEKWAENQQQATMDAADRRIAADAAFKAKERERDAFYQSIMGADAKRPQRSPTSNGWRPEDARALLNAAEKSGKAGEAADFLRDVLTQGELDGWGTKLIADREKDATRGELTVGYSTVKTGKPPHLQTWDELETSINAQVYVTRNARGEKNYRQWQEAHFEAIKEALARGWKVPDKVLYEYPKLIRDGLSDDDSDLAADAMVTTYQQTKDYAKAVQAYREWSPDVNLKGFTQTKDRGNFRLEDGNVTVLVERTKTWDGKERYQARLKNSTTASGPNLTEQQAVDWAANLRDDMRKAEPAADLSDLIQAYKEAKAQERALADAKNVDLNALARAVDATRAARAPLVAKLKEQPALFAKNGNGLLRIVAGSAQKPGQWQLTRFDQNAEPWGDSQYTSQEAAIDDFLREVDIDTLEFGGGTPAEPAAAPAESTAEIKRRGEFQDRMRAYWDGTATPAIRDYLRAFDAFGADRMERNQIKPKGMTPREWLESFVVRQSKWDGSRKVQGTGIEALSAKDLWPTDDGLGERLRKSMLAAVRALKNAPMTSGEMLADAFMEKPAAPSASPPAPADRPDIAAIRRDATLDKKTSENGEVMTRRQWVERKVAEGLKPRIEQEDRIKPMSRMAYFRATNEEQRAHERKIKEAGKKDVYWIGDYEVTKTEHDYAVSLAASAPAPAAPAPAPQEPAKPVEAPVSSAAGQKNLAYRGSRIASLMAMNEQIRKLDPTEAWHPDNIKDATDLDALQDSISSTLVRLQREREPTPAPPEKDGGSVDFRIDATDLPADTAAAYAAAPTEADQRAVRQLQLRMVQYIPGLRLDAVAAAGGRTAGQPLQGADRARVAAAELLRALTGRRAVFFTAHRTNFINGVHSSSQPDVLFLRADASRPHMAVLGHEFLHGLRADRPDLYEALRERIRLVAPGRAAHAADLQAKRQGVGQPLLSNDKLEEEFLADVMGDSWMDAAFWRDLAGKEPAGPLRRAFEAALRFINDVLAKLGDLNPFGTDVYLDDVRAARAAMAKALRDYVEVESVGAPEIGVDSFSTDQRAPWYSALERAIAAQPMRGGGASAWENAIKGLIASGKVKADEVEWSGLRDWLGMQPGLVTKQAVQQYLKANGVQVQETVLSDHTVRKLPDGWRVADNGDGTFSVLDDDSNEMGEGESEQEAIANAQDEDAYESTPGAPRYNQPDLVLPGGTNYREVLLTLPVPTEDPRLALLRERALAIEDLPETQERTPEQEAELKRLRDEIRAIKGAQPAKYRSNHWDQYNVLAHIRLNDRTDADGKRVLFVEEIQSDWAQQAKKDGFVGDLIPQNTAWEAVDTLDEFDTREQAQAWADTNPPPNPGANMEARLVVNERERFGWAAGQPSRWVVVEEQRSTVSQAPQLGGLPRAPFVDKTDKWVALALKRIVKMAVDEGYDRVAMTTGKQQADRYGLDKQADKVVVTPRTDMRTGEKTRSVAISLKAGGVLTLGVDRNGVIDNVNGPIAGQHIEGKALDDVIGKEMAERVMAVERATFEGEDLRVGGRGMIAFYDRIVPSALKDLLRKVGGGQIGEVRLPGDGSRTYDDLTRLSDEIAARVYGQGTTYGSLPAESQAKVREMVKKRELQQPGFDITPKMREAAAGGMPMFSLAPRQQQTDTSEFKRWFKGSKVVDAQGKPLVVYHGTSKSESGGAFTTFDTYGSDYGLFGQGSYFTESPAVASNYTSKGRGDAQTVYPVFLSIKSPIDMDKPANAEAWESGFPEVSFRGDFKPNGSSNEAFYRRVEEHYRDEQYTKWEAAQAIQEQLIGMGHDGITHIGGGRRRDAAERHRVWVAFDPEQIKSATGNRGTFDPNEADINFSIAVDALQSNETARRLSERAMDVIRSDSTIGVLGRTVGTPYHLAHAKNADGSLRNPDLRRVYDEAQDYLNDINTFANDPAELAPGVVPMLNKWSDARNPLRLAGEKRARLARALFEGTLGWTRDDQGNPVESDDARGAGIEWTATELKQRYGFDDVDVKLYQQARAAIARSLDFMAAAEVARQMGGRDLPEGLRAMVSRGDTGRFRGLVTNFLTQQVDGAQWALRMLKTEHREQLAAITGPEADAKRAALKAEQAIALEVAQERLDKWQGLQRGVAKVYDRVTDLKDRGYMPLMRFGPHTVTVRDIETRQVLFFGMYETQAEANVEARRLRESAAPNETVTRGEMSQEQWRLFKGMSPETIELFGQVAGVERTPVFEEYIRRTKANHSALKRLIQRKGTPGFSEDVQRVLAAFLTSNARAAAANLHAGAMEEATLAIDQERGLVKDYATRLTQYVQNPTDEAQGIRGLMFIQFIGGSVASALVNMTQPFTMTLPYLSQHGGPGAASRLLTAGMRKALTKIDPQSPLGVAMQRAEKDGIVSPQALHELQGQAVNRFGRIESGLRSLGVSTKAAEAIDSNLRRVLFAWGGFFSLAEQFNRRATFAAAYQLAQERQMADPFEFASEAVSATQGVYNRGNRPQWARGPVGATVMTFKQFSISYLEFLSRLPRREKAIALGVLTLAAGLEGLPFADDLDDLIDTIMQRLFGKAFSAKRAKVEALTAMGMSRDSAEWVLRGASALPGFPVDLAGRMSLGNMIPGTGVLRTDGAKDKSAEVLEALGPAGGVVRDALRGEFSPVAVRNAFKGAEMFRTGQYRDELGRKVADVDGADAAAKALGFQPREIARESRGSRMAQSVVAQTRAAESDIVRLWAQGIADNEPDKVAEARAQLEAWNQRNPEARIAINRMQIARQVRDMRATREERLIRATPKELRGRVAQELQQ